MNRSELAYINLQKHLDRQAVGFPATRSGTEIKILKHIFTPEEAEITSCLSYKFESLETIFVKTRQIVQDIKALEKVLDRILEKGGIELKVKNGAKHYCCAPLVVGMYEFQTQRLSPEFVKDFNAYTSDRKFGVEFLSTALPQMRTIPIAKSIHPQNAVSTFDEVTSLLQEAEGPFQIVECICRKKRTVEGAACEATRRQETCLAIGHMAAMAIRNGSGRKITRDEAISIIQQNQEEGLVLQPSNTAKAEFICSCCGCCCGLLRMHKTLPIPLNFWATNYQASVDPKACDGCRSCEERCQVGAVAVSDAAQQAVVDLNKCIGCGLCVAACPTEALSLIKRPNELIPPSTREDLYDIIMANKKGRLGKLKLSGRLFWDAIRTGQTHLLRSPQ